MAGGPQQKSPVSRTLTVTSWGHGGSWVSSAFGCCRSPVSKPPWSAGGTRKLWRRATGWGERDGEKGNTRRRSLPHTRPVCAVSPADLPEGGETRFAAALNYQFLPGCSSRRRARVPRTGRAPVTRHEAAEERCESIAPPAAPTQGRGGAGKGCRRQRGAEAWGDGVALTAAERRRSHAASDPSILAMSPTRPRARSESWPQPSEGAARGHAPSAPERAPPRSPRRCCAFESHVLLWRSCGARSSARQRLEQVHF